MKRTRLDSIVNSFREKRVAVIGDLMLDVYIWGSASRISPEAPVPVVNVSKKTQCLGGASNLMRNIVTLGGKVLAFGVVGDDPNGRNVKTMLNEYSINSDSVLLDPSRQTTEKQRIIASRQQILRIDFESTAPVNEALREKIISRLIYLIETKEIDAIIFEDYAKGMLDSNIMNRISKAASEAGIITALDPHPDHPEVVKNLTLLKPNKNEAFSLAGIYQRKTDSAKKEDLSLKTVAAALKESWDPEYLLITLGSEGMAMFDRHDNYFSIPTRAREVFDVSGAGDTVIAALTLAMLGGAKVEEAAEIANHAAGIVVGKIGTVAVTLDELFESFGYGD